MPRFLTSFLLSILLSLGLPYIFCGLTFKLSSCTGGMFCLPLGLDFFPFLGLLLFGFPLFTSFILLSFIFGRVGLDKRLVDASFVAQPAWPISGFAMIVQLTDLLAFIPQILFWALFVHLARIYMSKYRKQS